MKHNQLRNPRANTHFSPDAACWIMVTLLVTFLAACHNPVDSLLVKAALTQMPADKELSATTNTIEVVTKELDISNDEASTIHTPDPHLGSPSIAPSSDEPPGQPQLPVTVGTPVPETIPITRDNAGSIELLARWGKGHVNSLTYSPDGQVLAAGTTNGVVFYNAMTYAEIDFIPTDDEVQSVVYAPDGQSFAIYLHQFRDSLQLWRHGESSPFATIDSRYPLDLVFSSDGTSMSVISMLEGTQNGDVSESPIYLLEEWRIEDSALIKENEVTLALSTASEYWFSFSPDGSTLVGIGFNEDDTSMLYTSMLYLWKIPEGIQFYDEFYPGMLFPPLFLTPDSFVSVLYTEDAEPSSLRFNVLSPLEVVMEKSEPLEYMMADYTDPVALLSDGKELFVPMGYDIGLFSTEDSTLIKSFVGHSWWIESIAVSPDQQTMASGSIDGTIKIWRIADGTLQATLEGYINGGSTYGYALDTEQKMIAIQAQEEVYLRGLTNGEIESVIGKSVLQDFIYIGSDAFLVVNDYNENDGRWLYQLTRLSDNSVVSNLEGLIGYSYTQPSPSSNGQILAASSYPPSANRDNNNIREIDYEICIWNLPDETLLSKLENLPSDDFALSPDGALLAAFLVDGSPGIWRVADNSLHIKLEGTTEEEIKNGGRFEFSPDGKAIAFGSSSKGTVRLWDVSTGNLIAAFQADLDSANGGMAFSPDGQMLAIGESLQGNSQGLIQLWDIANSQPLITIDGGSGSVDKLAFVNNGQILFSGMSDGTIRLWGIPSLDYD